MTKELEALKTIKIKCHPNSNPSPLVDDALEVVEQALQRLEAIDKLEEQLGCPLEVVERALMNGIYTNVYNGLCIVSRFQDVLNVSDDYSVYIKDYKKTWWLKDDRSE